MTAAPGMLFRWADIELDKVTEMVSRKEIRGNGESLVQTYLKKGALVPVHEHAGAQWVYVLQGDARGHNRRRDGHRARRGRGPRARGTPHQAEALDDTFVLDISANDGSRAAVER